ncbi:MAG: hypothetical protein E5Y58_07150 [Mesorhizobium sp.]|nr:MAG: hypothetical protein E5Y58_07150 [Mesorhizobium sp.]
MLQNLPVVSGIQDERQPSAPTHARKFLLVGGRYPVLVAKFPSFESVSRLIFATSQNRMFCDDQANRMLLRIFLQQVKPRETSAPQANIAL